MTTITRERLLKIQKWRETYGPGSNVVLPAEEAEELARIALASITAEPIGAFHIADQQVGGTSDYIKDGEWPIDNGVIEVYAAPPALQERRKVAADPVLYAAEETLTYAKHGELHMTCLSEPMGDAVIPLYTAPPAPVVPEEMPVHTGPREFGRPQAYVDGWNACRAAMLQSFGNSEQFNEIGSWNNHKNTPTAKPAIDTCELIKQIEGMEVSVDVSTCDADAGHRYFGTVTEVSELDTAKNGYILLVQDAEPNFKPAGNSPVIPDGYALVPIEPTHAMINAWLSEVANWRGHVAGYKAMLAAAPQQEVQSQVQEQRVAIREEMAMGSRLTNHRFRVK